MEQDHGKSAADKAQKKALRQARKAGTEGNASTAERKEKPGTEKAGAGAGPNKPETTGGDAGQGSAKRAERKAANQAERAARKAERIKQREGRKAQPKVSAPPPDTAPVPPATVETNGKPDHFNILIIAQAGRLAREAAIFAASLRRFSPNWRGRLIVAEPLPEGAWSDQKIAIPKPVREFLTGLGAEIIPFAAEHFGKSYPYGNKIEALHVLPGDEPFVFFDSDTLVTGPLDRIGFDFSRPSASMRREGSWPIPPLYGPGYAEIWRSLYDRFGLDFESSLDLDQPDEHWERYLYFNAGWFMGADPHEFGRRFLRYALEIRDDPGEALASQSLDPWLDQAALPLVIHSLGGGRPGPELAGLDGSATCHYRNLSLLYARETEETLAAFETITALAEIERLMQGNEAYEKLFRQRAGRTGIRPLFAGRKLPSKEQAIRHEIRKAELWFRG